MFYQISEKQLHELTKGRLQDNIGVHDGNYRGLYVIVHAAFVFGRMMWLSLIDVYDSCTQACHACVSYNQAALSRCLSGDKLGDEFEVWHVLDDGDLGGYKIMDGDQCVLCAESIPNRLYCLAYHSYATDGLVSVEYYDDEREFAEAMARAFAQDMELFDSSVVRYLDPANRLYAYTADYKYQSLACDLLVVRLYDFE